MQADSLLCDPPGGSACSAEHMGLIPALGSSLHWEESTPVFLIGNPMDR